MATENVKSRKAYRILTDPINKVWDRINLLTNAQSVDADDGQNLETKVGKIKGITKDTNVAQEGYAADATVIKALNDSLGGLKFAQNDEGKWGYKPSGADAVIPFKSVGDSIYYVQPTRVGYTTPHETHLIEVDVRGYDSLFVYWECASQHGQANIEYRENNVKSNNAVIGKLNLVDISNIDNIQMTQISGNKSSCQANYTMAFVVFNKGTGLTIDV